MKNSLKIEKDILKQEISNSISHGIGVILGILFLVLLIIKNLNKDNTLGIVAFSIYGGSFILLFLASTIYHGVPFPRLKKILRVFDHISIYYFIAGSFTPIILLLTSGKFRIIFISLIWAIALFGTVFKIITYNKFDNTKVFSLITYISMGWLGVFLIKPILENASWKLLLFIILGGLLYTIGTYFYKSTKLKYSHFIWHLFVLGAAVMHFYGFYFYL